MNVKSAKFPGSAKTKSVAHRGEPLSLIEGGAPQPDATEPATLANATPSVSPVLPEEEGIGLSIANIEPVSEDRLVEVLLQELQTALSVSASASAEGVVRRIAVEVERICEKSDRIQTSGQLNSWRMTLAQHRLKKLLAYYRLGSQRGRLELHSHLSTIVYRHVARSDAQLGFQGRYALIEDFMQGFYIEVLRTFRKENELAAHYSPRTRVELAEYMAFTEQYAKRRINLPGRRNQQLIVLRAQGFAKRQPAEASVDIELAVESGKGDEAELHSRSPLMQQLREQMVSDASDPTDSVLRDRVVNELIQYLESQDQTDCVNYLTLKLQDLSAPEIDDILGLSPRQRDYLQQRFKYHVEKFARSHRWELVHQWLGADLDQNLGMPQQQWELFQTTLSPDQLQLIALKAEQASDQAIAKALGCTTKQAHKRWVTVLELAWEFRNQG